MSVPVLRVKKLGAGDFLVPKKFTGEIAAASLGRLIESPEVAQACRGIKERMAAVNALTQTAQCIEQLG